MLYHALKISGKKMKTMFWEAYKDEPVILSGDGRMSSCYDGHFLECHIGR
jgi:hypothetical protein